MSSDATYMTRQILEQLVGKTIVCPILDTDDEFYGFQVVDTAGNRQNVWVSSDAEGNGAGWLSIEEAI